MKLKMARMLSNWIPALILLFLRGPLDCVYVFEPKRYTQSQSRSKKVTTMDCGNTLALSCPRFGGTFASDYVTLKSIEIFNSHELTKENPTVYFRCQGENKIYLPDVKQTNTVYTFKGQESWQPLTALTGRKCKRCGIYEEDLMLDDIFDEWELCPEDFSLAPEGKYKHYKEKEVNATFSCPQCNSESGTGKPGKSDSSITKSKLWIVLILILIATVIISTIAAFLYKVWQRKKRGEEQARFLKLFEDDDDVEIEMGLTDAT